MRKEALEIPRTATARSVALLYVKFLPSVGQEDSHKRPGIPSMEFPNQEIHVSCEMLARGFLKKQKKKQGVEVKYLFCVPCV